MLNAAERDAHLGVFDAVERGACMIAWPQETIRESDDVLFDGAPRERFTVVAVHEDKCWIQNPQGRDEIVPLSRCILRGALH